MAERCAEHEFPEGPAIHEAQNSSNPESKYVNNIKERLFVPKITTAVIRNEFGGPKVLPAWGFVTGRVASSKTGTSSYGDFERFRGEFRLYVPIEGKEQNGFKEFRSTQAIFPDSLEGEILLKLAERQNDSPIEFGAKLVVDHHPTKEGTAFWRVEALTAPDQKTEERFVALLGEQAGVLGGVVAKKGK